jgi:hypothetical protein
VREFSNECPPQEVIEKIIYAGQLAPFSPFSFSPTGDFRQFYIISKESETLEILIPILNDQLIEVYENMRDSRLFHFWIKEISRRL